MIPISILLGAIVVMTVAAISIWLHPTKLAKGIVGGALVIAIIFAIFCIALNAGAKSELNYLTVRYDDLMLYYNTVVNSENEYVRYDYYDKVNAYNEAYEKVIAASESKWNGWFYPAEDIAKLNTIDFTLHGDNFYGEG